MGQLGISLRWVGVFIEDNSMGQPGYFIEG
jgi:hypothetical protein